MNKQEQRIIDAARKVLSNWIDGGINTDVSGDFTELEVAFDSYYNPSAMDFDWQSFRNQAAKDILCAIISCPIIKNLKDDEGNLIPFDKFAATKVAIEYADELVKQLKEKEEK